MAVAEAAPKSAVVAPFSLYDAFYASGDDVAGAAEMYALTDETGMYERLSHGAVDRTSAHAYDAWEAVEAEASEATAALDTLLSLGFDEALCRGVLPTVGGVVEEAIEKLTSMSDLDRVMMMTSPDVTASMEKGKVERAVLARDWNGEFQRALDMPTQTADQEMARAQQVKAVCEEFADCAAEIGKVIISEVSLPVESRKYKPSTRFGGIAGGDKYFVDGILFKFARDVRSMYGGDENAAKAAENELRGLTAILNCAIPGLHVPLMALLDYMGHRLIATSVVPIDDSTIVLGTPDAGRTMYSSSAELNQLMEEVGGMLNLKAHAVGHHGVKVIGPADLEGHLGKDGRFYLLDAARLFPPMPSSSKPGSHLYMQLRPEFLHRYPFPLSSDAFTGFGRIDALEHNREVAAAIRYLREEYVPIVARTLEENWSSSQDITALLHSYGINMRLLGLVRSHLKHSDLRAVCLMEMVARTIKQDVRRRLRTASLASESEVRSYLVGYFRLALGKEALLSSRFWIDLEEMVKEKFERALDDSDDLCGGLMPHVDVWWLSSRLQTMLGVTFSSLEESLIGLDGSKKDASASEAKLAEADEAEEAAEAASSEASPLARETLAAVAAWQCSECTLENPAEATVCAACGAQADTGLSWKCRVCTATNRPSIMRCSICSSPASMDSWDCRCGARVHEGVNVCPACNTTHPMIDLLRRNVAARRGKRQHRKHRKLRKMRKMRKSRGLGWGGRNTYAGGFMEDEHPYGMDEDEDDGGFAGDGFAPPMQALVGGGGGGGGGGAGGGGGGGDGSADYSMYLRHRARVGGDPRPHAVRQRFLTTSWKRVELTEETLQSVEVKVKHLHVLSSGIGSALLRRAEASIGHNRIALLEAAVDAFSNSVTSNPSDITSLCGWARALTLLAQMDRFLLPEVLRHFTEARELAVSAVLAAASAAQKQTALFAMCATLLRQAAALCRMRAVDEAEALLAPLSESLSELPEGNPRRQLVSAIQPYLSSAIASSKLRRGGDRPEEVDAAAEGERSKWQSALRALLPAAEGLQDDAIAAWARQQLAWALLMPVVAPPTADVAAARDALALLGSGTDSGKEGQAVASLLRGISQLRMGEYARSKDGGVEAARRLLAAAVSNLRLAVSEKEALYNTVICPTPPAVEEMLTAALNSCAAVSEDATVVDALRAEAHALAAGVSVVEEQDIVLRYGNHVEEVDRRGRLLYRWTLFVTTADAAHLRFVRNVLVELHPSFKNPVQLLREAPYELTRTGWGTFPISLTIHFGHPYRKSVRLSYDLVFAEGGEMKELAITLR